MAQTDEFGSELADFVRRVGELTAARGLPQPEQQTLLEAALFELQHVAESLWPRYQRLAAAQRGATGADPAEQQLFKAVFQRLPLPVALIGGDTVVRRMNLAATELTGVRAGYAAGRPLAGLLRPGDRAALRSQAAAVARGEGARSLRIHLQQRPDETLLATLTALRPPAEPRPSVLAVVQSEGAQSAPTAGRHPAVPDLGEATRHAELTDLLDAMTTALLRGPDEDASPGPDWALATAARVFAGRFADWAIGDLSAHGALSRTVVLAPAEAGARALPKRVERQDPAACPLVAETARGGTSSLQVRPEDLECFGVDETGASVLVQAGVTSLLCVPLRLPRDGGGGQGAVHGVLTLFRTGARLAFSMAEARAVDVMSHHIALAMRRRPAQP
ncbi:PAS domain-containing protein [Streptomyces sp. NPDC051907]|uniref:PAS domain-containing protein n=1 Tax=Streptomyces sp. NPDC051907 TaxID=3155284 RepID=UPI00343D4B17